MHHDTNRKVEGSIPDKVIEFVSIYLILPAALWPLDWLSIYKLVPEIFLWDNGGQSGRRADNLTAICQHSV
jgi:hypothetical protein